MGETSSNSRLAVKCREQQSDVRRVCNVSDTDPEERNRLHFYHLLVIEHGAEAAHTFVRMSYSWLRKVSSSA